jgi:formylglycine-generating enzyme required for sulfatase activity
MFNGKKLKYVIAGIVLLGALAGCEFLMGPQEPDAGNVTIQLGSGNNGKSRTISQTVIDTLRYEVEFRGPEGLVINRSVPAGTGTINLSLALGEWTISAEAYTPEGILAGTGSRTITVVPGMSPVIINMNEAASVSAKAVTAFAITSPAAATGIIDETLHTVTIEVPHGTTVTNMIPSITHTGTSISPSPGTAQNFTGPVTYTVTAADTTTQAYTVTVNVAAINAKAITAFAITSPAAAGIINETLHTVTIDVPFGTTVTGMTTYITHTGASISPASGAAQDFSSPVTYTVTAADGTTQPYTVTVNAAASTAKAITAFTITSPAAATGIINEALHTVTIDVPLGTAINNMTTSITHTGASISPAAGSGADFSTAQTYTVTAGDTTTQAYTVTVNVAPSTAKAITGFSFASPAAAGTINEGAKTIALTVPYGTALASLTPTITITGASVSPVSGAAQNFAGPVTYTVTAADTTTQTYTVTVAFAAPGAGLQISSTAGGVTFKLRYVPATPAGGFQRDETAANKSIITNSYWMGETEVTQGLFEAVMGSGVKPSYFTTNPEDGGTDGWKKLPVERINWYHAIAFCNKLSILAGKTPVYSVSGISDWAGLAYSAIPASDDATWNAAAMNVSANGYRLPTEMEWMWAAMGATGISTGYSKAFAGSTGSNSIGDFAWYGSNASSKTHEVGKKLSNELGLYDMSGNVYEWCWDWHNDANYLEAGTLTDYTGPASGYTAKERRGEYYLSAPSTKGMVATRAYLIPSGGSSYGGFRVVCRP